MAILWCGGEDIDFGASGSLPTATTNANHFRGTYSRCGVQSSATDNVNFRSNPFPGGSVTSCWLSVRTNGLGGTGSYKGCGFRDSVTGGCLIIGTNASSAQKLALFKYDGTTATQLAAESGTSITSTGNSNIDWVVMQVQNYGASSTVNVWINGLLVITFSGNCTVASATSVNSVVVCGNTIFTGRVSEVIVSDNDIRGIVGLATLALTGAGVNQAWTNPTFSNINATSASVATPTNSNTAAQETDYNVTDLPAGTYSVPACKQTIWAAVSSSPTATQIKMGYNHAGGSASFGTGSTKTPGIAYGSFEQLDSTDPVSAAAWAQSNMNALQVAYTSV